MEILALLFLGLVVGAIARLVVPGRHAIGFFGTMAVGVAGAFLGWWIGKGLVGDKYHAHPWIWATIGAILVVLVVSALTRGRAPGRRWW